VGRSQFVVSAIVLQFSSIEILVRKRQRRRPNGRQTSFVLESVISFLFFSPNYRQRQPTTKQGSAEAEDGQENSLQKIPSYKPL